MMSLKSSATSCCSRRSANRVREALPAVPIPGGDRSPARGRGSCDSASTASRSARGNADRNAAPAPCAPDRQARAETDDEDAILIRTAQG
jgi:hypothetical protein